MDFASLLSFKLNTLWFSNFKSAVDDLIKIQKKDTKKKLKKGVALKTGVANAAKNKVRLEANNS